MLRRSFSRFVAVPEALRGFTTPVTSRGAASQLFDGARYALLDCGGTLWEADKPIPRINETLDYMRHGLGLKIRFITNNATASREDTLRSKFHRLGMTSVTKDELFSSAYAAQVTLRRLGSDGKLFDRGNVLVLGNDGLHEELEQALAPGFFTYGRELKGLGFDEHDGTNCDGEPLLFQHASYDIKQIQRAWSEPLLPPPQSWIGRTGHSYSRRGVALKDLGIGAVVIGLDFKFTPTALALGAMALQQHRKGIDKALFIATNKDPQMPTPDGWLMPGCGSLVAALEVAANRTPDVVCGKPTAKMFRLFQESEELAGNGRVCPSQCIMVGDRLSTDIAFGNNVGARTLHVRTGCETLEDLPQPGVISESRRRRQIPQFAAESLPAAVEAIHAPLHQQAKPHHVHRLSAVPPKAPVSVLRDAFGDEAVQVAM